MLMNDHFVFKLHVLKHAHSHPQPHPYAISTTINTNQMLHNHQLIIHQSSMTSMTAPHVEAPPNEEATSLPHRNHINDSFEDELLHLHLQVLTFNLYTMHLYTMHLLYVLFCIFFNFKF